MGMPKFSDMNLYEYNKSSTRIVIVSCANTSVRLSKLVNEGMPTAVYKSPKDEELGDDLEH